MNAYLYSLYALDVARQRSREAEEQWLASTIVSPDRGSRLRRPAAQALAWISRGSASVARRLDSRTGDDLGRALSATD